MRASTETRAAAPAGPGAPPIESGLGRMLGLAWPVAVTTSTVTLLQITNLFWIGQLGTDAVAAVSMAGHILFILFGISQVVSVGSVAIISRRVGEGDAAEAFVASVHAVALGAVLGVVVGLLGSLAAPVTVAFFETSGGVEKLAVPYLQITLLGQAFLFATMGLGAAYQAAGDTRTPMVLHSVVVLLNTVVDPFLIFAPGDYVLAGLDLGWLGWGVEGAAVADLVAGAVGVVAFLLVSWLGGRPFPRPRGVRLRLEPQRWVQIIRVGVPAGVSFIARPSSTFFLMKIIASFGTPALAAFGIALRSFSFNWIPYSGLTAAVATLVGQNLGSGQVDAARAVVRRGVVLAGGFAVFFAVTYTLWAEDFMAFFDDDPAVVAIGVPFLVLIAMSFLASGTTTPLVAAMNGAGETRPPMISAFVSNWLLKLPLCWFLARPLGMGTNGVWVGMLVSIVTEAAINVWWFRRGSWTTREV